MTYNEWRDELKSNLLTVSDAERKRVLDYYAEAYADRRAAGYSEREIIEGFGAPYDAAQAILDDGYSYEDTGSRTEKRSREKDDYFDEPRYERKDRERHERAHHERERSGEEKKSSGIPAIIIILLCIIFAGPLFGLIMGAFGITVGFITAPIGLAITGTVNIVGGIVSMISSLSLSGLVGIGMGIILIGAAVILEPLCFKLVKLIWKAVSMLFRAIGRLIRGK